MAKLVMILVTSVLLLVLLEPSDCRKHRRPGSHHHSHHGHHSNKHPSHPHHHSSHHHLGHHSDHHSDHHDEKHHKKGFKDWGSKILNGADALLSNPLISAAAAAAIHSSGEISEGNGEFESTFHSNEESLQNMHAVLKDLETNGVEEALEKMNTNEADLEDSREDSQEDTEEEESESGSNESGDEYE